MLAPSPCCVTCHKRVSQFQDRFRLLRIGKPMLIDRLISLDLADRYDDIVTSYTDTNNYKQTFADLDLKDRYKEFIDTKSMQLEAKEIYDRFNIRRLCCMQEIAQPHVIPGYAAEKPPGSQLQLPDGSVQKFLRMKGRDYEIKQLYPEDEGTNLYSDIPASINTIKIKRKPKVDITD